MTKSAMEEGEDFINTGHIYLNISEVAEVKNIIRNLITELKESERKLSAAEKVVDAYKTFCAASEKPATSIFLKAKLDAELILGEALTNYREQGESDE